MLIPAHTPAGIESELRDIATDDSIKVQVNGSNDHLLIDDPNNVLTNVLISYVTLRIVQHDTRMRYGMIEMASGLTVKPAREFNDAQGIPRRWVVGPFRVAGH